MKIGLFTPTLADGDAVGNDLIGMTQSLIKKGYAAFISAEHSAFRVSAPQSLWDLGEDDVYIYHHSIYSEIGVEILEKLKCKKIIKYHNITPPYLFPEFAPQNQSCKLGIEQTKKIANMSCKILVDSEYNGQDVKAYNPELEYDVLSPYNQVDSLKKSTANNLLYNDWITNIVMIGRVAPSKNLGLGIRGFAEYKKTNPYSRLLIIGDDHMSSYVCELRALISSLGLGKSATIVGKVTLEQLKAYYLIADVLLIPSLHEGFCVPIVEAMAFNVPVVANRNTAIPFTGGEAILYFDKQEEIGELLKRAILNKQHYAQLGRERFRKNFSNSTIEEKFLAIVDKLLSQ